MINDKDQKPEKPVTNQPPQPETPSDDKSQNTPTSKPVNPSQKKKHETKKDGNTSINSTSTGDNNEFNVARTIYKTEIINKNKEFKKYLLGDPKSIKIHPFQISDNFFPLAAETIDQLKQIFVYPDQSIDGLLSLFKIYRMLLLTGEPHTGKYTTAQYLCHAIMRTSPNNYEVGFVEPLEREINVDLLDLVRKNRSLTKKIVIFKKISSGKYHNLIAFLSYCSREQIAYLSNRLQQLDTFFLFTADTGTFDQYPLANLPFKCDMFSLDDPLLEKGFTLKLQQFCSPGSGRDSALAAQLLDGKKKEIIHQLGRMSQISLFIETYLDRILSGEKSIDDAIVEVKDIRIRLEHWVLKELGGNFNELETWTFVLCLALLGRISYADFYEIHREVTWRLLKILDPFRTFKNFTYAACENLLLQKGHAQIVKDTQTSADYVEFCDNRYQTVLLKIILRNNRNVLLPLLSYFEDYVKNHIRPEQRQCVSILLARIGLIDPEAIIRPLIDKWTRMEDNTHRSNVGYLFEGILACDNKEYFEFGMDVLTDMALSDNINEQWTAIATFKQIGLHNLELSMKELKSILQRMMTQKKLLDAVLLPATLLSDRDLLTALDEMYENTDYLLSTVCYAIIAIAINTGKTIDVLTELQKWIHDGKAEDRIMVTLFLLSNEGIFEELEARLVVFRSENKEEKEMEMRSNMICYDLAESTDAIGKMTSFLHDLYTKCFAEFRIEWSHELKSVLFDHMKQWVVENLGNTSIMNALEQLILQLYRSGDGELKDTLWDSINRWEVEGDKEPQLKACLDNITRQLFT